MVACNVDVPRAIRVAAVCVGAGGDDRIVANDDVVRKRRVHCPVPGAAMRKRYLS